LPCLGLSELLLSFLMAGLLCTLECV
jgi:hypothetical protein